MAHADACQSAPECLRIEGLSKTFGHFTALESIDLSIREGEFVCFLGPSGCGKTTLLRAIAGLELQSRGRIIQQGRDISWLPPQERDFGIVFQSYALFPNLSVKDNIAYGLRNQRRQRQKIQQRVDELLALIDLQGSGDKYPAQLSGGQQQRVALARALATEPGLLLLDEPLSALDARVRLHLRQQIKALQQRLGVTTIMVTHDQEEALTMADRVVVMNHGSIEQIGTPQEIYREPVSPFVASFVGSMNLLKANVEGRQSVRLGKQLLSCQLHDLADRSTALLAIRPEEIKLLTPTDAALEQDLITAEVKYVEYLGACQRLHCQLEGAQQPVLVDIGQTALDSVQAERGSRVYLQFPSCMNRIFAHEGH
ncbi:putative 2-aminoethylphosphonate ABC transporter ATP-binding protein [Nitrincola sp. MINF-07-Sa-05]|uniref:putative 2-aminoethylphosphonate ABC transporter ATP-binding protein n=1 Tax=Nitrincola salilacus TaxID=3400273 RepID=UPI0039184305